MAKNYIAHVRQDENGRWVEHTLDEHLHKVAQKAGEFARAFGSEDWANPAGLWHDLGKYRPAFQVHIKKGSGYVPDAHITSENNPITAHASTGALYAVEKLGSHGTILAYLIAGHHAGLPDFETDDAKGRALWEILQADKDLLREALEQNIPDNILNGDLPKTPPLGHPENFHLWIRMLFSCLVDADFLDTESFMSPDKTTTRTQSVTPQKLLPCFNQYMESLQLKAQNTTVNHIRSEILTACRNKAIGQTGVYTMTVPTGGGKTLSSLAFALEHAAKHNKQRIIYVIPYTSIIEQTANIFRDIFKPLGDILIEHHSNTEPDKERNENSWSRLATENWDATLIVTTTVQLFESLYAARTSRCRKLHNLVNSVIVLDEIQLLPPEQLNPIRHIIQSLNQYYGVTFVITTATPSGFKEHISPFGKKLLQGVSSEEIIDSPVNYYDQLNRVHYRLPDNFSHSQSWVEIAEELTDHESVLAIVNTRKDAKELWEIMPKGTYHLSTLMCAEHRSQIIKEIRERLKPGHDEPTKVISTQLVEAGVDFDFPVVYRALAGLDSIVQAAGRCNREGKLDKGEVVVFVPPADPPRGILSTATHTAVSILTGFTGDIQAPDTFQRYFEQFFAGVKEHDKYGVLNKLQQAAIEGQIQFRTAAQRFRMIDDKDTVPIFVRYGEGDSLVNILGKGKPHRWLLRKLQRFTVTLYRYQFEAMLNRGDIQEICKGFYAQSGSCIYSDDLGLMVEQSELTPINSVI